MDDLPLFTGQYPRSPGYRDADTSREAAKTIEPVAKFMREKVLAAMNVPMSDWEIADACGLPFDCVQPRRSELLADGFVKFSGEYGISGRSKKRVKRWIRTA